MTVRTEELVARIRAQIRADEKANPKPAEEWPRPFPPLKRSQWLASANRGWAIDPRGEISSHRPVVGPAIVAVKRLLQRLVLSVLAPYFERERAQLADLVRFENEVAERCDRLAVELEERERSLRERLELVEARLRALEQHRQRP